MLKITSQVKNRFRGIIQSDDGHITKVMEYKKSQIIFQAAFALPGILIEKISDSPQHIVFSERSRIARLGIQIKCEKPTVKHLSNQEILLTLTASTVISGYPEFEILKFFFTVGFPIGRLAYCDPDAILTSEEVLKAISRAEIKLPESTSVATDGSILISPRKVVCSLTQPLDKALLERILLSENGRELLGQFQKQEQVQALIIPPKEGVITTCSMYLNNHYILLQSGFELGRHLSATILDPIKTRGINIYLEIYNGSNHVIVNPMIFAKIYKAAKTSYMPGPYFQKKGIQHLSYDHLENIKTKLDNPQKQTCGSFNKSICAVSHNPDNSLKTTFLINGPKNICKIPKNICFSSQGDFSTKSICPNIYATSKLKKELKDNEFTLILKYFPNLIEHRDILDLISKGKIKSIYFFTPSYRHGNFLSQHDHNHLHDYQAFGVDIYWISPLNNSIMIHTTRDGKGYFVNCNKMSAFHKSMLFAFYGSNKKLSEQGTSRLGKLMDMLIEFWGKNIGIITGGGSGVMELANSFAQKRGILSGANFLEITDQSMTTDVDFCQVFQATCRHSRQKWFEITSFPIFNIGGIGTLEELGITLCNMKLSVIDPVPVILFDTEKNGAFWKNIKNQIIEMISADRAPEWIRHNIFITNDPKEIINIYKKHLHLF